MFTGLENGLGLDVVLFLQQHSNPVFDQLAILLNALGTEFIIILLVAVYYSISKAVGKRLLFALTLSALVAALFKALVAAPRPFEVSDQIVALVAAGGGGFPSGHVMTTVVVWGYFALWAKKRWVTVLVIGYVMLQAWGRMVAGVHYPQDIIGGLLIGLIVLAGFWFFVERLAESWQTYPVYIDFGAPILLGMVLLFFFYWDETAVTAIGALTGGMYGFIFEYRRIRFSIQAQPWQHVIRYGLGVLLSLGMLLILKALFENLSPEAGWRVLRYGLVSFTAIALVPWLGVQLKLFNQISES
ncbi:hypothetical protein MASR2M15_01110 [Anaerolineales bacterium]